MKKKFTMLFAALLAFAGVAKADVTDLPQISTVENPIYYTIYNTRSEQPGGLMYYAGDNVGLKDGCTSLTLENKYKFFFTGTHEAMYIHNAATGKKLASVDSWTDAGIEWTVSAPTSNGLAFGPKGENGNVFWNDKNYGTNENTSDFTVWSATDAGSIFVVELAEDFVAPISGLFYVIEAPLFEKVQGETGKKAIYVNDQNKAVWGAEDLTNHNFYWIPTVKDDGTIALKNFGTGEYLSDAAGVMSKDAVYGNLNALGSNSFNIKIGGTLHAAGHDSGKGANGNLTSWGGVIGSASAWSFVQKNDPTALVEVTVNYEFTYEDEVKYTQEGVETFVGEEYPAITVSFPYGVSASKPTGVIAAEDVVDGVVTKTIELSVAELPFVAAANNNSIENWYYINIHTNPLNTGFLQYTEENTYIACELKGQVAADNKDAYTWAFVGNIFDGFKLVNKKAGIEQAVNSDGSSAPVLGNYATGVDWQMIVSRTNNAAQYFCFKYPKGECLNAPTSGQLSFWWDNDNGSTMWVTERDLSGATELLALVESANAMANALSESTGVGSVTSESLAALVSEIEKAQAAADAKEGCIEAQVTLQAAIDGLVTVQPEEGKFYTIASAMPESDGRSGQSIYVNENGGMNFSNEEGASKLFQFVSAGEGKFYLYNVENGSYLNTAKGHSGGQAEAKAFATDGAKAVTITNMGRSNAVKIVPEGGAMLHAQASGSSVVAWNNDDNAGASAWTISEVEFSLTDLNHTLTVSEAGWATLVLGYNTTIPTGVKAYAVSNIAEGKAVLAEVADVLPAHTPVLIEAVANDYTFEYTATEATVESNQLAGSVFNTEVAPVEGTTNYVLSNNGGVVALYKKTTTNDAGKIVFAANKAYLPVQTAAEGAPAMFAFSRGGDDEDTTGIDQLINANGEVVIYDLAGRRVEKMEKGIYIVNGVKVIR